MDDKSNVKQEGETKTKLDEKYLTIEPVFGEPLLFSYADITSIHDHDYSVDITFTSNEKLTINRLGYKYEDFLFQLFKARNELLLKYLLMQESLIQSGFEAQYTSIAADGQTQNGKCELRLYETAMLILPQKAIPIRLPYCYISQINKGDYRLTIIDESQQEIEVSQLGGNFDPFVKSLSDAYNKMMTRSQETIKELIPEADPVTLRKIASLMKDGRAAKRKDLEDLSKTFWHRLAKKIDEAAFKAEYDFLDSSSISAQEYVGLKRGLMGDLTGSYTWMLFPLRDPSSGRLSNTLAMEAFNNQDSSQQKNPEQPSNEEESESNETAGPNGAGATYFFRFMERKEYAKASEEELFGRLADFIKLLNRAIIDINFRREPIYLSNEQLESTKYTQYRFAIESIPSLKLLRSQFIGRVIHSSLEQWKSDISNIVAFNTKSLDDNEKWKKGHLLNS